MGHLVTDTQKRDWQRRRDEGESVAQISCTTGRPRRTIYDHTHRPVDASPRVQDRSPDLVTIQSWQLMREQGWSIDAIAERDGWGHSTVAKYTTTPLARRKRARTDKVTPKEVDAWRELAQDGYTIKAIAKRYGRRISQVGMWLAT